MQVGVVWRKEGRVEGEQVSGTKYLEVSKFSADSRRFSQMRSYGLNMRPSPPRTTWPAEDDIAADKAIRSPNIIRPRSGDDNVSPPPLARGRRPAMCLATFGVNPRAMEDMVLHHLHPQPAEVQGNCFQNTWSYSLGTRVIIRVREAQSRQSHSTTSNHLGKNQKIK